MRPVRLRPVDTSIRSELRHLTFIVLSPTQRASSKGARDRAHHRGAPTRALVLPQQAPIQPHYRMGVGRPICLLTGYTGGSRDETRERSPGNRWRTRIIRWCFGAFDTALRSGPDRRVIPAFL